MGVQLALAPFQSWSTSEVERERAMPATGRIWTGSRTAVRELIGNTNRVDTGHS